MRVSQCSFFFLQYVWLFKKRKERNKILHVYVRVRGRDRRLFGKGILAWIQLVKVCGFASIDRDIAPREDGYVLRERDRERIDDAHDCHTCETRYEFMRLFVRYDATLALMNNILYYDAIDWRICRTRVSRCLTREIRDKNYNNNNRLTNATVTLHRRYHFSLDNVTVVYNDCYITFTLLRVRDYKYNLWCDVIVNWSLSDCVSLSSLSLSFFSSLILTACMSGNKYNAIRQPYELSQSIRLSYHDKYTYAH